MKRFKMLGFIGPLAVVMAVSATAANATSFTGFGEGIPLESAARQIVPDGWAVEFGDGVDKSTAVSWSSAKDWKAALSAAVAKKGYSVQYGDARVTVAKSRQQPTADVASTAVHAPVRKASPPRAYAGPRKEAVSTERKRITAAPERPAVRNEVVRNEAVGGGGFVIVPLRGGALSKDSSEWREYKAGKDDPASSTASASSPSLRVSEGDSLRTVVEGWATKHGWKLVWKSDFNYPIAAPASFDGDFVQATTALVKAFDSARPAITVDFYTGNNVVVISNASSDEAN